MLSVVDPIAPKILPKLDIWAGMVSAEIELSDCVVNNADFSKAQRLEIEGCKLVGAQLAGCRLTKLQLSDVELKCIEAAGLYAPESAWLRVLLEDSRLTGADLGHSLFEDCAFNNVKFDEAGFRFATFKRVHFENCVLRHADFSSAKFSNILFTSCDLENANFDNAICKSVDLRSENLATIKGVHGLKGATISAEQLIQLAPLLAVEAGLDVDYET